LTVRLILYERFGRPNQLTDGRPQSFRPVLRGFVRFTVLM